MKHFLGCIPPFSIVMAASAYAYAQSSNTTMMTAPVTDFTTVLTGVGTGGLTIWFCMKWVGSELERSKESKEALNQKHKDEIEKLNSEWNKRYEELLAQKDSEKDLRIQTERDYAERLKDTLSNVQANNLMLMESVRTLAQIDKDKKNGNPA